MGHSLIYRDASGGTRWRVVAANGRPVGQSPAAFADEPAALLAIQELAMSIDGLPVSIYHNPAGTGWIWQVFDRTGVPVAASTRHYERNATCRLSYRKFAKILSEAAHDHTVP